MWHQPSATLMHLPGRRYDCRLNQTKFCTHQLKGSCLTWICLTQGSPRQNTQTMHLKIFRNFQFFHLEEVRRNVLQSLSERHSYKVAICIVEHSLLAKTFVWIRAKLANVGNFCEFGHFVKFLIRPCWYTWALTICPRHASNMPQMMPQTCHRHVTDMSQTCPRHAQIMLQTCSSWCPRWWPRHAPDNTQDIPQMMAQLMPQTYLSVS